MYSAPGTTKILPESNMSLGCSEYIIFCRKMVLMLENFVLLRFAANHNNKVRGALQIKILPIVCTNGWQLSKI